MATPPHCTTWHVRVDLIDAGAGVLARAELLGAPRAMAAHGRTHPHDGCLERCPDIEYLSTWQSVVDLAPALVDALSAGHEVGFGTSSEDRGGPAAD